MSPEPPHPSNLLASHATLTSPGRPRAIATRDGKEDGTDRPLGALNLAPPDGLPEIAGYRLLKKLGDGGMGVVYLAEHLALRRIVAVKMLRSGDLASDDELARFAIEAEAVARLQHPNIVQVFDFGQHAGRRYLSLEFCEAGTLAARIAGHPQPPREAARMAETLARAVHAAHLRGIIHRDLKPHNVLLAADGTPKISDFGLAKLTSGQGQADSSMMVGTAGYMAPEQAWGSGPASEIGPAADVYGLGVILYEMLTGRLPFQGSTPRDTLEQVWTKQPPRPRACRPDVPRDLETICLKCLEKLPHQRYASGEALADDLARFQAGEPISIRPAGSIERCVKWARRRPATAALLTVTCMAAIVVLSLTGWYQVQVNKNYRLAKGNLQQAQQAVDQLINRASIEGLAPLPHSESLRRDLLEAALRLCEQLQIENPADLDLLRQTLRAGRQRADLYQLLGRPAEAKAGYERAIAAQQRFPARDQQSRDRRELAVVYNNLANLLLREGELSAARKNYTDSIAVWKGLCDQHPGEPDYRRGLGAAKNNLALTLAAAGELRSAQAAEAEALTIRKSLVIKSPGDAELQLELASSQNNLATFLKSVGKYADAEHLLGEARDSLAHGRDSDVARPPAARFTLASIENNRAAVLAALGQHEQSEQAYRQAIDQLERLSADFPGIVGYRQALADACSNFALLLIPSKDPQRAAPYLQRSLEINQSLLAATPNAIAPRLGQLLALVRKAELAAREGQTGLAQRTIVDAVRLGEALVKDAPQNPDVKTAQASALETMGRMLADRHLLADARHAYEQATTLARAATKHAPDAVAPRSELMRADAALAKLLIELGDAAEASRLAEEIASLATGQARQTLETVQLLAMCIPLATGIKGKEGGIRDGIPLDEYCARKAIELLKPLREQGIDVQSLSGDPALAALTERPEFKALLEKSQR